ncbi:ribose transport system permease protein [Natronobacillus azotifigens]|uniref:Sugar ABC transporter permease n=1 Tax=Natronobacillus azotifigens TaxID=472978 RepID=A0A9J6R7L6_9BACI|nr:hypothetical protein [Natronobacillus azotifigens]MCZ0701613.1 hypothetical protein [Natronobacillus azotifigens]
MKLFQSIKKIGIVISIPVGVFVVLTFLTQIQGISLFAHAGHVQTFVRSTTIISFTAWALALNLQSGRFDFSLGSMAILSSIIGTQITINYGLPAFSLIFVIVFISGLLGLFSGLVYITLKLAPIITSVGVMLIYEALTFVLTDGQGLLISTQFDLLVLPSTRNLLIILLVGFAIVYFIMNHTQFGYNHKALQHGQEIAVNTGLPEKRNAILTYMLAGMLMGVVGFINMTTQGFTGVSLNFTSISAMFIAFLPMFIGGYIGRFSEERFGIFIGSLTMGLVTLGFVRLDLPRQTQEFVNALLLLAFLTYLNNQGRLKLIFAFRKKSVNHSK